MNEECIIDPLDLIDSVDDMSAIQKTELRDAARINFRNRVEFARIVNQDSSAITDATSLSDGDNVIVTIRASGVSGVTRLVLDFDGTSGIVITDATELEPLNTGDDISFPISGSLPSGTYTNDTELEILLEGASSEVELIIATLGDLIGDGRTIEDADLVVTPERVKSAIDNTDNTARGEIRDNLDVYNKAEVDDAIAAGGDTSTLAENARLEYVRSTIAGIDTVTLRELEAPNHEVLRLERMVDGDGNVTWDIVASGNVRAG